MRSRKILVVGGAGVLAIIAIVLFATAGSTSDQPPPKVDEFAQKADQTCLNVERSQAKISAEVFKGVPFNQPAPDAKLSEYARRILPGLEKQLQAVKKSNPPQKEKDRFRLYTAEAEQVVAVMRKVAAGNAGLLRRRGNLLARADDVARKLGLLECGHFED